MFLTMFIKECRQTFRSLLYWIIIIIFIIFITSQMWDDELMEALNPPASGRDYYGLLETDDQDIIMGQTLKTLYIEADSGVFATYPAGFYKEVTPSGQEIDEIKDILERASGKSWEELTEDWYTYLEAGEGLDETEFDVAWHTYGLSLADGYTYEKFQQDMDRVCEIVGKGSSYEKSSYEKAASVQMTYEDAMEQYVILCEKDGITNALMRLYCDYAGIMLAFLAIFPGVSVVLRDRRAKAADVVYSKKVSSFKICISRYLANVIMLFLPVIITAGFIEMPYVYAAQRIGISVNLFAFIYIPVIWLLPEIMVVMAAAFGICEAAGGIAAIILQVYWGMASLMSADTLTGNFGLHLITRWNMFGGYTEFMNECSSFYINRGYYLVLSVFIVGISIFIYNWKRRNGGIMPWKR